MLFWKIFGSSRVDELNTHLLPVHHEKSLPIHWDKLFLPMCFQTHILNSISNWLKFRINHAGMFDSILINNWFGLVMEYPKNFDIRLCIFSLIHSFKVGSCWLVATEFMQLTTAFNTEWPCFATIDGYILSLHLPFFKTPWWTSHTFEA